MAITSIAQFVTVACALLHTALACDATLPPTDTFHADYNTAVAVTNGAPFRVCLLAGYYGGCSFSTLSTSGGDPVELIGAGVNVTTIKCSVKADFVIADVDGGVVANMSIIQFDSEAVDVIADDVLIYNVHIETLVKQVGQGILNSGTLTIVNSSFSHLSSWGDGAAVSNDGSLTVIDCSFWNLNGAKGGAIYSSGPLLTILGSRFTDCVSTSNGGGVNSLASVVEATNCTFVNMWASGAGGAMFITFQPFSLVGCVFYNASAGGGAGAVLVNQANPFVMTNCSVTLAEHVSAAVEVFGSFAMTVQGSNFYGCHSVTPSGSGALSVRFANAGALVQNCVFESGSGSDEAAGLDADSGAVVARNCHFLDNVGGSSVVLTQGSNDLTLIDCVFREPLFPQTANLISGNSDYMAVVNTSIADSGGKVINSILDELIVDGLSIDNVISDGLASCTVSTTFEWVNSWSYQHVSLVVAAEYVNMISMTKDAVYYNNSFIESYGHSFSFFSGSVVDCQFVEVPEQAFALQNSGVVEISKCLFSKCQLALTLSGSTSINDTLFLDNTGSPTGGAMYIQTSSTAVLGHDVRVYRNYGYSGAGVRCGADAAVVVEGGGSAVFVNNSAVSDGAAITCGRASVRNAEFVSNYAGSFGGVGCFECVLKDLVFHKGREVDVAVYVDARASNLTFDSGGMSLYGAGSTVGGTVSGAYFVSSPGAALSIADADGLDLADITVCSAPPSGNPVEEAFASLYISSNVTLTDATFVNTDDSATRPAFLCTADNENIVLANVLIEGFTGDTGAAIEMDAGAVSMSIVNSTVRHNSGNFGGAFAVRGGQLTVEGTSVTDCSATIGGAIYASGQGSSVVVSRSNITGNYAATVGSAFLCLSAAECSFVGGTLVSANRGSVAGFALFLGSIRTGGAVFTDNAEGGIGVYGGVLVLSETTLYGNGGSAVDVVNSPLNMTDCVLRANVGEEALRLSAALDVRVERSYVASNMGVGVLCTAPKDGYSTVLVGSVVCDNSLDYDCSSDCDVTGAPGACNPDNSTDCGAFCAANEDFCVADNGFFAGPYDGCFECGGACDNGTFSCPEFAVCVDAADGGYTCACPSGFSGNGTVPCDDADECALGLDNCSPNANCTNTPGSFTCSCHGGYRGTGVWCVDIDECGTGTHDCVAGAVCTNTEGGHVCECDDTHYGPSGYTQCYTCPANTHSFVGATNVTDCECDTNTFNLDGVLGADCVPCPAGSYVVGAGAGVYVCVECPADSYSDSPNTAGECTACPESTTTGGVTGVTSVVNCTCAEGLDLVITPNYTRCERNCPAGTSRPEPDSQCVDCPVGRYGDQPNLAECVPCPLNSLTSSVGSVSVTNCTCVSGYAVPIGGAVGADCERWCPAGSYRPSPFSLDCPVCDIGSYSDEPNVGVCTPCPNNAVTPTSNSTAITDCECPPNYYTPERERGTECRPCPSGAKCKGGVSWPVARKGYIYVEGDDGSAGFAECVPFEACAGNGQCAEGYTGDLCERCKPNYYRLDGLCYECQNNAWLIVLACGLALFVFCAVLVWFNSQDRAINKFASIVIGVNALQIAGMYGRLNLNWPPLAQKFFAVLSLVNFNIELVSPECAVSVNDPFVLRWLLTMFFPVLVVAIFASIAGIGSLLMMVGACGYDAAASKWNPRYLRHTCIRAFYQLMTIGYLPLSAAVFEFFYCVKDASGVRVISTARQTVCYTSTYWGLFPVALLCFALYPIGVPLFCGFLLKTKRESLGEIKFSLRYGFLVGRFTSEYHYFELAIMARKLGVALAMGFLTDNAYVKAAGAVVVLVLSYSVQLRLMPYRTEVYNGLECACLLTSVLILLVSVVFQAGDTAELTRAVCIVLLLSILLIVVAIGLSHDAHTAVTAARDFSLTAAERADVSSPQDREEDFEEEVASDFTQKPGVAVYGETGNVAPATVKL